MGDVVPGVEEALALDPRSGVRRIKRRLIIRLVFLICKLQGIHVNQETLGLEQQRGQIMRWRGCLVKAGEPIVIF